MILCYDALQSKLLIVCAPIVGIVFFSDTACHVQIFTYGISKTQINIYVTGRVAGLGKVSLKHILFGDIRSSFFCYFNVGDMMIPPYFLFESFNRSMTSALFLLSRFPVDFSVKHSMQLLLYFNLPLVHAIAPRRSRLSLSGFNGGLAAKHLCENAWCR